MAIAPVRVEALATSAMTLPPATSSKLLGPALTALELKETAPFDGSAKISAAALLLSVKLSNEALKLLALAICKTAPVVVMDPPPVAAKFGAAPVKATPMALAPEPLMVRGPETLTEAPASTDTPVLLA